MKIRIISSREEFVSLDKEKMVHLSFRPSYKDIYDLVQACPRLKAIQIPSSYIKTISNSTRLFLDTKDITLLESDVWSQRKNINEYSEIRYGMFNRINELKSEGLSESALLDKLQEEMNLSRDTIKFLLKEKGKKK